MAFKSEIHVAELASIRTGHTEGDIYYILDNGMLGDLPCKPGTFVKWYDDTWQIQPDEHYALASAVDGEIAQAIDNILDDGQASETIVVAVPSSQSSDYTVGHYYEVQGKVARLRIKTDGDNATQLTFDIGSGLLDAMNGIVDNIASIGNPLQWKGPATVSELNTGISGIQPGWTYTLTDAGTLTDGSVAVEIGDEVAWTGTAWLKVGGPSSEIAVFQGTAAPGGTTYPDEAKVRAAVDAGKYVIIRIGGMGGYIYYGIGYQYANQYMFPNLLTHGLELRLQLNQQGTEYEWSTYSEPVHNSVVTFTGTLDPDASPVDYSGMPNSIDVESAIANGNEVRLELTSSSGYAVIYRLINGQQYNKIFAAMDGDHIGKSGYVNLIIMSYAGPGNPWHWSVAKALQQALNTQTKTESDLNNDHMEIASNNVVTKLTLTTVRNVTMHTSDDSLPPNFAVEIDNTGNSNDVTIDVQHGPDSLKYSVAGGNTVGAGKYMQLTCVGSCWTLAEFTAPTP